MISTLGLLGGAGPSPPPGFALYSAQSNFYVDVNLGDGITAQSNFYGANPAVVNGDEGMISAADSTGYPTLLLPDGIAVISAAGDGSPQTFQTDVYSYALRRWGGIVTDSVGDSGPTPVNAPGTAQVNGVVGTAITAVNLSNYITDPTGDNFAAGTMSFEISPLNTAALPDWLDFSGDTVTGTPDATGSADILFRATDAAGEYCDFDITFIVAVAVSPPTTVGMIPNQNWVQGVAITPLDANQYFSGATSFSESGTLPPGITFSAGVFSGTPTATGTYSGITVTGSNSAGSVPQTAFTVTIIASGGGGAPTDVGFIPSQSSTQDFPIVPINLPNYFQGAASFAVTSGSLPPGLSLSNGVISGVPSTPGVYSGIVITGSNASGSIPQQAFTWSVESSAANVYPAYLPGLAWSIDRDIIWKSSDQESLGGNAAILAYQQYPIYEFTLTYEVLRDGVTPSDFRALLGLFNSVKGQPSTFLFVDPDFNQVTQAAFGTGDGSTKSFQLVATLGNAGGPGIAEIIQNLSGFPLLYANGVLISGASFGIGPTGIITFVTAPAEGVALTWSGSFYYRCRFKEDTLSLSKFANALWEAKSVKIRTTVL